MLEKEGKNDIIAQFRLKESDTGSVEVQVALLSEKISRLTEHLKVNSHDCHSRRALLKVVGRRRKFLTYLGKSDPRRYYSLTSRLGLRK